MKYAHDSILIVYQEEEALKFGLMSKIWARSSLPAMESNGMERQCAEGMGAEVSGKFLG